jgi:hypothetical protein
LVTRTSADLQEKSKNELLKQIPIFNHHAANELEPLAIINRQPPLHCMSGCRRRTTADLADRQEFVENQGEF